jgi:hypothetical protein
MSQDKTRREFALLATGGLVITGLATAYSAPANAVQVNMDAARDKLKEAYDFLSRADGDKGGHRVTAMNLVQQAIAEVEAGIHFSNDH